MLRLRFERLDQGRALSYIAREAGMPAPVLSMMELGRVNPNEDELTRLASVLGVWPPSVLLEVVESKRHVEAAEPTR